MSKLIIGALLSAFAFTQSQNSALQEKQLQTVAIKVSGLHCEGCVEPVEKGLRQIKGVQSAKLEFKTGVAVVRYDEAQVALSQIIHALPKIPHAMGPRSKMKYEGRLLLTLAKGDPKKIAQALSKVNGVAKVQTERNTLLVTFKSDVVVRYAQIEQAVKQAGGTLAPVKPTDDQHRNHDHHH